MKKILVIDNSPRDAERLSALLETDYDFQAEVCASGVQAEAVLNERPADVVAVFVLHEIPGPPFAFELLRLCRKVLPGEPPLVVISSALDASLATRAYTLGASDFLEKPLDMERVKSCVEKLLFAQDSQLPVLKGLRESILGNSPALRATLKQVAKVIPHLETRVLLVGESGTGKELLAQAVHRLGPNAQGPCVAVNAGAIPSELIESQLFGYEKGAFTGAVDSHRGYLEEAGSGTLFLDEIGDLELPLQVKLLRVTQEKSFRRLNGNKDLAFGARLVCATNHDLAHSVEEGSFRRDLFYRIAEVTIHVPPLRSRNGDVDLLLEHFLAAAAGERRVRFARETLTILRSYPFPGNVRELENLVRAALIDCDGELILPHHLPLKSMSVFLAAESRDLRHTDPQDPARARNGDAPPAPAESVNPSHDKLFREIERVLPGNWLELPYKGVADEFQGALDRIYFASLIERYRHNVTKATKAAGVDKKTFDRHWKEAGLPPLRAEEEKPDG
jgi:DNA-binding NtrC family response regulator